MHFEEIQSNFFLLFLNKIDKHLFFINFFLIKFSKMMQRSERIVQKKILAHWLSDESANSLDSKEIKKKKFLISFFFFN